jgi:hypothetical protein
LGWVEFQAQDYWTRPLLRVTHLTLSCVSRRQASVRPSVIMMAMQSLRNAHQLARLVLVWFALFIGVSVASPWVSPQSVQMVCSAMGGMKMVIGDDGADPAAQPSGNMDCPLCAHVTAPPPPHIVWALEMPSPLAHALRAVLSAHIAWLTGSPLPPRGPPAFS